MLFQDLLKRNNEINLDCIKKCNYAMKYKYIEPVNIVLPYLTLHDPLKSKMRPHPTLMTSFPVIPVIRFEEELIFASGYNVSDYHQNVLLYL